jgi:hypothetical protein
MGETGFNRFPQKFQFASIALPKATCDGERPPWLAADIRETRRTRA